MNTAMVSGTISHMDAREPNENEFFAMESLSDIFKWSRLSNPKGQMVFSQGPGSLIRKVKGSMGIFKGPKGNGAPPKGHRDPKGRPFG